MPGTAPTEETRDEARPSVRASIAEGVLRWTLPPLLLGVLFAFVTLAVSESPAIAYASSVIWLGTLLGALVLRRKQRWLAAAALLCVGLVAVTSSAVLIGGVHSLAFIGSVVIVGLVVPLYGTRWGWLVVAWMLCVGALWLGLDAASLTTTPPVPSSVHVYVFTALVLVLNLLVLAAPMRLLNQALAEADQRLAQLEEAREQERTTALALQQAAEELERSRRLEALGRLSAGIAHDFNNMLGAIRGATDLMAMAVVDRDEAAVQNNLALLNDAAERATALTQKLLAFGRRNRFESRPVEVGALLGNVDKLSRHTLGGGLELRIDPPKEPLRVEGDSLALEQALVNLVLNARDALTRGGLITVQARAVYLEPEWCEASETPIAAGPGFQITVQDDGPGIPEEIRTHLFEPLMTTKAVGLGTGLGLAAVHGTVVSHHGLIEVQSEPGRGTAFHIVLPQLLDGAALRSVPPQSPGEHASPLAGVVAVVDDDPLSRRTVEALLKRIGIATESFTSGSAFLEQLKDHPDYLAVLSDVAMPGLTGLELRKQLQNSHPSLPLLLMSGFIPDDSVRGVNVLRKPFGCDQLEAALRDLLRRRGSGRATHAVSARLDATDS